MTTEIVIYSEARDRRLGWELFLRAHRIYYMLGVPFSARQAAETALQFGESYSAIVASICTPYGKAKRAERTEEHRTRQQTIKTFRH